MSRSIRPFSNDDECCDGDGPQNVGQGCAELTTSEPDPIEHMAAAVKAVRALRKMGACHVQIGEMIAIWPEAMGKESQSGDKP